MLYRPSAASLLINMQGSSIRLFPALPSLQGVCLRHTGSGVDPGNSPNAKKPQAVSKRLLVHNLFAMEVVSIAEALGVPSLALSPCLVPQAAPASLQRQLKRAHPALHAALTRPGDA